MPRKVNSAPRGKPPGLPISQTLCNENNIVWEHVLLLLESYQFDIATYTNEAERKAIPEAIDL